MTTHELTNANPALQEEIARRKQVEEALRRQTEYMAALHSTTLGLISRLDLKDLLQNIVVRAGQLLGAPHGFMYLLAPGGEELERKVGVGVFNVDRVPHLKPGEGLSGKVWQTGRPLVVNDYDAWSGRPTANVCVFADRQVDRSPTGSGVVARIALQHAAGLIPLGVERTFASVVGSTFTGKAVAATRVGDRPAVIVEVGGRSYYTGEATFSLEDDDPLPAFLIR